MKNEKMEILKDEILKNEGGTYTSELKNASLANGYMVSIEGYEYITNSPIDAIKKMIEYSKIIENKQAYFVGAWVDTQDNNKIYIDISKHVKSKQKAQETGRKNKQKAYYDIKNNKSIYLDYNIVYYSVYKNVYDKMGVLIDEIFIKQYDSTHDIPSNYRTDKTNYFIFKDFINIQDL